MNILSPLSSAEGQIHNQFIFDCFKISQCLYILEMGRILFIFKIHTSFVQLFVGLFYEPSIRCWDSQCIMVKKIGKVLECIWFHSNKVGLW